MTASAGVLREVRRPELEVDHPALPAPRRGRSGVAEAFTSRAPARLLRRRWPRFRHPRLDMRRGQEDAPSRRLNRISTALPPAPRAIRSRRRSAVSRLAATRMLVKTSTAERRATSTIPAMVSLPPKKKTSARRWAVPSTIPPVLGTTLPPLPRAAPDPCRCLFLCVCKMYGCKYHASMHVWMMCWHAYTYRNT